MKLDAYARLIRFSDITHEGNPIGVGKGAIKRKKSKSLKVLPLSSQAISWQEDALDRGKYR